MTVLRTAVRSMVFLRDAYLDLLFLSPLHPQWRAPYQTNAHITTRPRRM